MATFKNVLCSRSFRYMSFTNEYKHKSKILKIIWLYRIIDVVFHLFQIIQLQVYQGIQSDKLTYIILSIPNLFTFTFQNTSWKFNDELQMCMVS